MRSCHHCGDEFGIVQHIIRRGEFCSPKCKDAYMREDSRKFDWEEKNNQIGDAIRIRIGGGGFRPQGKSPTVVQLQEGNDECRLYFIGAELPEFLLAQSMGTERAIYGVRAPWPMAWRNAAAKNKVFALPTMEELAAPYAAAVTAHAGDSPCFLAGHSFSGQLAFEAAHQIHARGGNPEVVILLDARVRNHVSPSNIGWRKLKKDWKASTKGKLLSLLIGSYLTIQWILIRNLRASCRHFVNRILRDPGQLGNTIDENGERLRWGLLERVFRNAEACYRPRSLDCRGVLFRADPKAERIVRVLDGSLGWAGLFGRGLDIIPIPGDHISMMRNVSHRLILAREMAALLNRPNANSKEKLARCV
jgi:thioesterase domain-containing protein